MKFPEVAPVESDYIEDDLGFNEARFDIYVIRERLSQLALRAESYIVIGGANLVVRELKLLTPDIDLIVTRPAFDQLARRADAQVVNPPTVALRRGATNLTVHVSTSRRTPDISAYTHLSGNGYYPMTFESLEDGREFFDGVPLASLEQVIASKSALARPKDIEDLQRIKRIDPSVDIPAVRRSDSYDYIEF